MHGKGIPALVNYVSLQHFIHWKLINSTPFSLLSLEWYQGQTKLFLWSTQEILETQTKDHKFWSPAESKIWLKGKRQMKSRNWKVFSWKIAVNPRGQGWVCASVFYTYHVYINRHLHINTHKYVSLHKTISTRFCSCLCYMPIQAHV